MAISAYLSAAPLFEISTYSDSIPQDSVAFVGTPKKHPFENDKMILISEQKGIIRANIFEFRLSDVLFVEDMPSIVTEEKENIYLIKIWVRKGAQLSYIHR